MSILINLLLAFNVIVCLLLIFLVLMQRPKSEGLGAAFGGGMTENLFGAQTTNVLAKGTRILGGIFFALTLLLSILTSRQSAAKSSLSQQLANAPKPVVKEEKAQTTGTASAKSETPAPAASATPAATPAASPAAAATPAPSASPAAK